MVKLRMMLAAVVALTALAAAAPAQDIRGLLVRRVPELVRRGLA